MNANEVDELWILYQDKKQYYNKLIRQAEYENDLQEIYTRTKASSSKNKTSPKSGAPSSKSATTSKSSSLANQVVLWETTIRIIDSRELILDTPTRWSSTYYMIARALVVKQAYNRTLRGIPELQKFELTDDMKFMTRCQLKTNRFVVSVLTEYLTLDQWEYMIKHLGSKLSHATKTKVENIVKEIKKGQEEEAYYIAIESIRGAQPADKWIRASVAVVLKRIVNGVVTS
ncbi:hypothetical protein BDC45DRAFT_588363 [Circinella umbellata]|nr:hypothetical protein BDC45DRAFT_588363 [Circinella umbellata]